MNNNDQGEVYECEEEIAKLADDLRLRMWCVIYEDEEAKVPARRIVYGEENYYIDVKWKLDGMLARHFCGKWQVKVDLESIGDVPEYTSPVYECDMEPCKEDEYSHVFTIGPDDLQPHEIGTVYIPAVTLSTLDPCGDPGHMWGYCEFDSVMFVKAKPHED